MQTEVSLKNTLAAPGNTNEIVEPKIAYYDLSKHNEQMQHEMCETQRAAG